MLVTLIDSNGVEQLVTWQSQDKINDGSGNLGAGAVGNAAAPQQVAAANTERAGWLFQNTSQNQILLMEVNEIATSAWVINPFQMFPPNNYPIPTGAIYVQGTPTSQQGDTFVYREWVNSNVPVDDD